MFINWRVVRRFFYKIRLVFYGAAWLVSSLTITEIMFRYFGDGFALLTLITAIFGPFAVLGLYQVWKAAQKEIEEENEKTMQILRK